MSSSHERAIKGYLTPKNDILFKAFVAVEVMKCSEAINLMVSDYFQKFPPEKKQEYIAIARSKNAFK